MLLAELEVFHSRPAQPTRRVSLGHLVLPVDPAPGFGGLLLGAVVAHHIGALDPEVRSDLTRLIGQVERHDRIVQPRLRHRFQVDRHGLALSRHRLLGNGTEIEFDFSTTGSDLAQVLGAIYATERLAIDHRRTVCPLLRKATGWAGPTGPALLAYLAGSTATELSSLADPLGWAREVLGIDLDSEPVSKREVTRHYRRKMRSIHPDHGGAADGASKAILDLNEARRILIAESV